MISCDASSGPLEHYEVIVLYRLPVVLPGEHRHPGFAARRIDPQRVGIFIYGRTHTS